MTAARFDPSGMRGHRQKAFRGTILFAVLVVVVLAGLLVLHIAHSTIGVYREIRLRREFVQCQLLADSGLSRAIAATRRDPDYPGETWIVPALALPSRGVARVEILVQKNANNKRDSIDVVATYPAQSQPSTRARRQWFLDPAPNLTLPE